MSGTSVEAPGWSRCPEGLIWGEDARARLVTVLRMCSIMSPEESSMFAEPEPAASHEHAAAEALPCTCQALWMSGDMPPRAELPRRPGVYVCFDETCEPAYIGTSRSNVRARLLAHHRDSAKPALSGWLGFWPSEFSDSAAIWEIRLIDGLRPYLNRQHIAEPTDVQWEPKPPGPPVRPWYESEPHYQWFMDGPGGLLRMGDTMPWHVAKVIRGLFADGATEADIWDAFEITVDSQPDCEVPYLAAVVRYRMAERQP